MSEPTPSEPTSSTPTPGGKPNIFPALRYLDAPSAIAWLSSAFGFQKHFVLPDGQGGISHAELRLGAGVIMLGSARHDDLGTRTPLEAKAVTQTIYVCVGEREDVDTHYARAKAAGAHIIREIQDTSYNSREYTCKDLEGNVWSFGSYTPS
jgi:uncharacterized glyoxalase superfamily protein PhnB